jgi:predicted RecA/RadA family phage recombinase
MKNFAQPGNTVTLKAPRALKAGDGVVVGKAFGVAANDVAIGGKAEVSVQGVFSFKRTGGVTLTEGAAVSFDETTQMIVATGGKIIGYCVGHPSAADAVSPDDPAYSLVMLIPSFV